ncbi:hypothetical protein CWI82_01035 [Pseudidiomarina tainanensis]|uniref:Uncharacterized protein n=1 Tax=Pseudidiomarina tainanensis TaxID=502365 RepID=A0ACD2HHT2_9GAMM|nr:hypothetical protein CWI82_01035 [Pseudidiomarina tainanensis]
MRIIPNCNKRDVKLEILIMRNYSQFFVGKREIPQKNTPKPHPIRNKNNPIPTGEPQDKMTISSYITILLLQRLLLHQLIIRCY